MEERENFYRFSTLLLNIGTRVLRDVFTYHHLGSNTLAAYLSSNKSLLTKLPSSVLSQEQQDILFPPRGRNAVIEDFDITLLCILFRNLDSTTTSKSPVWSNPSITDVSFQADVGRIRVIRNFLYGHRSSASLDNSTFNTEVSNLKTIYHRLISTLPASQFSTAKHKQMIENELRDPLQPELENEIKRVTVKLEEWQRYDGDVQLTLCAIRAGIDGMNFSIQQLVKQKGKKRKTSIDRTEQQRIIGIAAMRSFTLEDLSKEWQSIETVLLEELDPTYILPFFKFLSENECQAICCKKTRREMVERFLIRVQEKLPDSFSVLLDALEKTSRGNLVLTMINIIQGTNDLKASDHVPSMSTMKVKVSVMPTNGSTSYNAEMKIKDNFKKDSAAFSFDLCSVVINVEKGSVIIHLQPLSKHAQETLAFFCQHGGMKDYVLSLLRKKDIFASLPMGEVYIKIKVSCQKEDTVSEGAHKPPEDFISESFEIVDNPQVIRENLLLQYGSLLEEIEPLHLQEAFLSRRILGKNFFEDLTNLRRRARVVRFLNEVLNIGSVAALIALVKALKGSRRETLATKLCCVEKKAHLGDTDQVDDTLVQVVREVSVMHEDEDVLWSCRLDLSIGRHGDEELPHFKSSLEAIESKSDTDIEKQDIMTLKPEWKTRQRHRHVFSDLKEEEELPHLKSSLEAIESKSDTDIKNQDITTLKPEGKTMKRDIHVFGDLEEEEEQPYLNPSLQGIGSKSDTDITKEDTTTLKPEIETLTNEGNVFVDLGEVEEQPYLNPSLQGIGSKSDTDITKEDTTTLKPEIETLTNEGNVFVDLGEVDLNQRILEQNQSHAVQLKMTTNVIETYPAMFQEVDNVKKTPAHYAAESGNIASLSYLIDRGTDPWCRTNKGKTLLHSACLKGQLEMTKYLVETYPKMLHEVDKSNRTPAHHAAESGSIAVLTYLLARGTYPLCRTNEEETLLHRSCVKGRLEITKYLIETYPKMLHEVDKSKRTPTHHAAYSGSVAVLIYLIDCGADPWYRTNDEETLLHRACVNGQLEMTKYLVETYPKMLHEVDNSKRTPAHRAAYSGNVAVLSYLLARGTDPWCRTNDEETLLHKACFNGQLEMTKYFVQSYPNMLHEMDKSKRTPVHHAAYSGSVAVLSYLLDRGTDPWCRTNEEETLLHKACFSGQLDMTKYLVETYPKMLHEVDNSKRTPAHRAAESGSVAVLRYLRDRGTDPWCRTNEEETLLHRACFNGQLEMTKYLVETYPKMLHEVDNSKRTPAHRAAYSGSIAVLSYLLDRGTDPLCRTNEGETLLHLACLNGQLEMTKYLVETYPKMLHEADNRNRTPAHHAAYSGSVAVLSYLLDRGTDPWCRTNDEETLLHKACFNGQLEMTKYFVQSYPKMLHEMDKSKRTPVHHAAYSGSVAVLSYLLDRGTDPWCRTNEEETLLHKACFSGQLDMTKYLVETYPKMLHEVDNSNRTPAHRAAESGSVAVLRYLRDRGTDPWCRTNEEETLLHRACFNGQLEMTKYLVETYPKMLHEVDKSKRTPAHHAAYSGSVAVVNYLIASGTHMWCRTNKEETLLHIACVNGQLEMTKYLVETYPKMLRQVDNSKCTPAHHAAEIGNVKVLSYLINRGADPLCRTVKEETLLHRACLNGQLEMTKYLVETYPKMLHKVDSSKRTPAHHAAYSGSVAVVNYLIDSGTDPLCRTNEEETLLHSACVKGQLEITIYLVETYPKMLHEMDNSKRTPAHRAAYCGSVAVLSYLIDRGADPLCRTNEEETLLHRACLNGQLEMTKYLVEIYPKMLHEVDKSKRTPVHHAAESGSVAVLSYLIDSGADPLCRTNEEQTLLHISCVKGQLEMTTYLVETYPKMLHEVDNSKSTPAHYAAESGSVAVLSYLLDRGTDLWCRTNKEETLLHRACLNGQLEMTKYLVETCPKMLHKVDNSKRTPAHCAAYSGSVAVLSHLIDRGADPWCRTNEKETLLHRACFNGQLEMTKYLVQTYLKMLHKVDRSKRTPAHHAAYSGSVAVLNYLIASGTYIWCRTNEEETLLHIACVNGQLEMIKYLVETYPKMLIQVDNSKCTPAHHATESGNVEVLSYLINRGADPLCRTDKEETLLHRACLNGQLEMTKYLVETYPKMLHEVDNSKRTPGHHAAYSGNVSVLRYLLDRGTDPLCRSNQEETLLHRACFNGQLEMAKYLVQSYPKMLHEVDKSKRTPAHHAAESGSVAVLSYIIDSGTGL